MVAKADGIRVKLGTRFHFGFFILWVGCCYAQICLPRKHAALFVFGASLFEVGNNNYINTTADNQANYWPYGETFFKYPSGRFSDGRAIPDFIAEYAKLPLTLPYLYPSYQRYVDGVNFASAGAGALVETHKGLVISLKTQLDNFINVKKLLRKELDDGETEKLLSNAVYLINIGTNDYTVLLEYSRSRILPPSFAKDYVRKVIGNLTTVVKGIYEEGGRKFGFLGMAPLGCLPSFRAHVNGSKGSCMEKASALGKQHNSALSLVLQKLERQLEGFKYSFTNYYDLFTDLVNFPSKYGLKEGKVACCGSGPYRGYYSCGGKRAVKEYELCENPSDYVFFDSSHPTESANRIFAKQMWSGNGNITGPYNLKTLFEDWSNHVC